MNFSQLLAAARFELGDTEGITDSDHILITSNALMYFNEAIHEACRRAHLLIDRTTPEICRATVTANNAVIPVDPRIIKIRSASLASRSEPLRRKYVADMDELHPGWESHTGSTDSYVADYETGSICLYRIPSASDTLKLVVSRLPIADLAGDDDVPEINARFHPALVQYVIFKVRSIDDTELYDLAKATKAEAAFEREFGPKRSAAVEMYEDSQPYEAGE